MRDGRQRGFTFIEMTVVLIIIAIGTALVVPMIEGGFDSREVRRAARQIASTMHHCRNEAVQVGRPQVLVIDALKNAIYMSDYGRWAELTDRAVIERIEGGQTGGDGWVVTVLCYPNGSTSGVNVILGSRRDRQRNRLSVRLDSVIGNVKVEDAIL